MGQKLGMEAKLYRNTRQLRSPTWVEMKNVKDLTLNLEAGEADVTTRGNNGWRATIGHAQGRLDRVRDGLGHGRRRLHRHQGRLLQQRRRGIRRDGRRRSPTPAPRACGPASRSPSSAATSRWKRPSRSASRPSRPTPNTPPEWMTGGS